QSLSAPAPLCGTGPARGKSFRPTASSPYRKATIKSLQKCPAQPPMADISIWQKTGHFYFALTSLLPPRRQLPGEVNLFNFCFIVFQVSEDFLLGFLRRACVNNPSYHSRLFRMT